MDDFSITDARLTSALEQLRLVNRWLGGYAATRAALTPLLRRTRRLHVLDLGTGAADYPEHLVRWADRRGAHLEVTAVDANPVTVDVARAALRRRLPARLRARIHLEEGDALALSFEDDAFDVAHAALFMHHFDEADAVRLLRGMNRVARRGLVVNDLHRHPLAFYGIRTLAWLGSASPMFRHDAPLSVLRGYCRDELRALVRRAGLSRAEVRWRWAFRWLLTTVSD